MDTEKELVAATQKALERVSSLPYYTLTDVKNHRKDGWTIIDEYVYNLKNYNDHPGGHMVVRGLFGRNGTVEFYKYHGGEDKPYHILQKYLIGNYNIIT